MTPKSSIKLQDVELASVYHVDFWRVLIHQRDVPVQDLVPRVFQTLIGLMMHLYMSGADAVHESVILSTFDPHQRRGQEVEQMRRVVDSHLAQAQSMGLVSSSSEGWKLTNDGLVFVRQGLRDRQRLSTHTSFALSPEQVCRTCSEGEIEDWNDAIADMRAHMDGPIGGEPIRSQMADSIVAQTVEKAKRHSTTVDSLWAGLLMV